MVWFGKNDDYEPNEEEKRIVQQRDREEKGRRKQKERLEIEQWNRENPPTLKPDWVANARRITFGTKDECVGSAAKRLGMNIDGKPTSFWRPHMYITWELFADGSILCLMIGTATFTLI